MACASPAIAFYPSKPTITLDLMNVGADGQLGAPTQVRISGDVTATRLIGQTLVLVTTHFPKIGAEYFATEAERQAALDAVKESELLPTVSVDGAAERPLVQGTQCFVQPGNTSTDLRVTTITTVDMSAPGFSSSSRCFLGGVEATYMSPTNLYLASSRWPAPVVDANGVWTYPTDVSIDVHKFAVSGMDVSYRASGNVNGHLGWVRDLNAYRFSEHQGDLRVLSFTGELGWWWDRGSSGASGVAPSPATLTVLRENSARQTLDVVGKLPNANRPAAIGLSGEQVYAVRFLGDKAYVVTFRRTDPLYVIDLSNPADPRQVGELKVTGVSHTLHPLGEGLLLGIGKDADFNGVITGVKVSLFDVSNPAAPTLISSRSYGSPGSSTAADWTAHGVSFLRSGSVVRVGLPMSLMSSSGFDATQEVALHRFDVDLSARALTVKPRVGARTGAYVGVNVSNDRSVHIGDHVYYYTHGGLTGHAW
jgi:hypothetical protein